MRTITNSAGFTERDADDADQPAVVDIRLRHRRAVAFDEVRLFDLGSFEAAVAPDQSQKIGNRSAHPRPQIFLVRLEDHPLQAAVDRCLDENHQPAHIEVFPVGIAGDNAPAVNADAAVGVAEITNDVDVDRIGIENVMLLFVDNALQPDDAAHDFVGRRLVHAALDVRARVDADDVSRWRNRIIGNLAEIHRIGIGNQQPRMIERRIFCVVLLALRLHIGKRVLWRPRTVENGDAITHQLAMTDQRVLDHRRRASRSRRRC